MIFGSQDEARQARRGLAFIAPWLFGFVTLTVLPIGMSLYYSLCDYSLTTSPFYVGLANFRELLWAPDPLNSADPADAAGLKFSALALIAASLLAAWLVFGKGGEGGWRRPAAGALVGLAAAFCAVFALRAFTAGHGDPIFWKSLWNTVRYAMMALPAGMLVSLGLAMMLNVPLRGQAVYRAIIFLPSLMPLVATAIVWMWLYEAKNGLINSGLHLLGFKDVPGWMVSESLAMPSLAFMSVWGVGNTVVIYLAGLQDVPRELYEAAEIDGAGAWGRLWHVTIPLLSPVIFFNLVMAVIGTMQVFAIPYVMTQGLGTPLRSTYFYTMYMYDSAFKSLRMGYASAMAWIQLLIILALTGIAFWSSKKWVHYQGK